MKGFNLVKVLSFILQLGFCSLGVDYLCDNDDAEMSQVIQHFRELGLVFKRKVFTELSEKFLRFCREPQSDSIPPDWPFRFPSAVVKLQTQHKTSLS